jgi:hypothetical protein
MGRMTFEVDYDILKRNAVIWERSDRMQARERTVNRG